MKVIIDTHSGFCFGVQYAVELAEGHLDTHDSLYSLGDIVHNQVEVDRLNSKGLKIISKENFSSLKDTSVLIRAHGEPPETYKIALENNITIIDASCPVVIKLQKRVQEFYMKGYQILLYGKPSHAEIIGINGQCNGEAIIFASHHLEEQKEMVDKINFHKKTVLISQTTQSIAELFKLRDALKVEFQKRGNDAEIETDFIAKDTICRQVANRDHHLASFANNQDVVIFVSGKKSSNGKVLYQSCKTANERSYFIEDTHELQSDWFHNASGFLYENIGVCGATSTPMWLMQKVAKTIEEYA